MSKAIGSDGSAVAAAVAPGPDDTASVATKGITTAEAKERLAADGPNAIADPSVHSLRNALSKFWEPVPWLLEASIVLEIVLHKYMEAGVIGFLLFFNAILAFVQEGRAQATLTALKSRLALVASVKRDGKWASVPAADIVRGDIVKLSLGGVVPADVHLISGSVLIDQSMLTGESVAVEAGQGTNTYAGALVRRGEATAEVTATGARTKFGRTAELVRTAHGASSQQKAVLQIVRNLAIFNGGVILLIAGYALAHRMPSSEFVALLLTAVLAAIPVALPATFTLAAALGARNLAKVGVLPTRLSAVDEAASIDVLCSDKTGTLTLNSPKVDSVRPIAGVDEAHVLGMAALASSTAGQDPVDEAIRVASSRQPVLGLPLRTKFIPFDPEKRVAEAIVTDSKKAELRIAKGAIEAILALAAPAPEAAGIAAELVNQGAQVLAVAAGPKGSLKLIGLIALNDPPRPDSSSMISELGALGVRTVMITGDAPATAAIVAREVGLPGKVCPPGPLPADVSPNEFSVFARILPEGKYQLVKAFQKSGHLIGMCGDGANDAPALRQAQIGIAVSTATDVAKSAAGVVLTQSGLGGIVAAVKEGRITFQRILTYTLNSVLKKIVQVLLLAVGLVITGHAVLTPLLMVVLMITGDFLAMSLTTDTVEPSQTPNSWRIGRITAAGVILGACFLAFCTAVLAIGKFEMGLGIEALRTLMVVAVAFGSQATIYALRARHHFWGPRPSRWLAGSSLADIAIITALAILGIAMAPLPAWVVAAEFAAALAFGLILSALKIPIFARLHIA